MRNLLVGLCAVLVGCAVQVDPPVETSMTRPANSALWATNATWATGPNIGSPTKVMPGAGVLADGWRNTDVPPPASQNWWQGNVGDWVAYHESLLLGPQVVSVAAINPVTTDFVSTTSNVYQDVTGSGLNMTAALNDLFMVTANVNAKITGGVGAGFVGLFVRDGAGDHLLVEQGISGTGLVHLSGAVVYAATTLGVKTIFVKASADSVHTVTVFGPLTLSALQLRPTP